MAGTNTSSVADYFLNGDNFVADTPWRPGVAMLAAIGFFLFQVIVATVTMVVMAIAFVDLKVPSTGAIDIFSVPGIGDAINVALLTCEALGFLLILYVSGRKGGDPARVLLLEAPRPGYLPWLFALVALAGFFVVFTTTVNFLFPEQGLESEVQMRKLFSMLADSKYMWAGVVAIVIGAPLFEEAIFRGFLLTAFARTGLGFRGAAIFTSLLWAGLHAGYAPVMLAGLFVLGLLLALAVKRSGSIWTSIAMHGLWNGMVTIATIRELTQTTMT